MHKSKASDVVGDDASTAAERAYALVRQAVVSAGAAVIVKRIEPGKIASGSKRQTVTKEREEALKLADILAFAAERDMRTGSGVVGAYKDTGDETADESGRAKHLRQRGALIGKEKSRISALEEYNRASVIQEMTKAYLHHALTEGAKATVEAHLKELVPDLSNARLELMKAGAGKTDAFTAQRAVTEAIPKITKKYVTQVTDAIAGPTLRSGKTKPLRDKLKDESAVAATKVLQETIAAESGPTAAKAKLTGQVLDSRFTAESVNFALRSIGTLIDKVAKSNGDSLKLEVVVKIPVSHGAFVGLKVTGSAAKFRDRTNVDATFSFTAGWDAAIAQAMAEVGGYIKTASDRQGRGCMEMASYALYRRCRESVAVPTDLTNALWGMGGITKVKGQTDKEAKHAESESWARGIEDSMTKNDLAETGLHLGVSGRLGNKNVAHGELAATVDTGTRYTKAGVENARKQNLGKTVGTNGRQSSIGQKVTTVQVKGTAAWPGGDAEATLSCTIADTAGPLAKRGKVLAFSIDGGLSFKVPASGLVAEVVKWIASGVSTLGSATIKTMNKAKQGDKLGTAKQVASDLEKAGKTVEGFPEASKAVKEKAGELLAGNYYRLNGLEQRIPLMGAHSAVINKEYLKEASSLQHPTPSSTTDKFLSGTKSAVSSIGIVGKIDVVNPKASYIAVEQATKTSIDLHALEATISKSSAILYYDFTNRRLEAGGSRYGQY